MAVERLKRCENIVALSEELGVHRRLLYKWRDQLTQLTSAPNRRRRTARIHAPERGRPAKATAGEKTLEVDFSKVPCKKSRLDAKKHGITGGRHYDQIRGVMSMQGSLSNRANVSAGWGWPGRHLSVVAGEDAGEEDMEVRSAIQQIAVEHRRRYGIDGSAPSYGGGGCWLITSVCCGSYAKTTCWPCSRGRSW